MLMYRSGYLLELLKLLLLNVLLLWPLLLLLVLRYSHQDHRNCLLMVVWTHASLVVHRGRQQIQTTRWSSMHPRLEHSFLLRCRWLWWSSKLRRGITLCESWSWLCYKLLLLLGMVKLGCVPGFFLGLELHEGGRHLRLRRLA